MEIIFFILFVLFLYYYGKTILTVLLALVVIGLVVQVVRLYPGYVIGIAGAVILGGIAVMVIAYLKDRKPCKAPQITEKSQDKGLWCDWDTGYILQVPPEERPLVRRLAHASEDATWLLLQSHDGKIVRSGISSLAYWLADNWSMTALTAFVYVPEWFAEHPEKIQDLPVIPEALLCA